MEKHDFGAILTSIDVVNIQDEIGKVFVYREDMVVNAYFGPRKQIDHMKHLTMDLENFGLKLIVIERHIFP